MVTETEPVTEAEVIADPSLSTPPPEPAPREETPSAVESGEETPAVEGEAKAPVDETPLERMSLQELRDKAYAKGLNATEVARRDVLENAESNRRYNLQVENNRLQAEEQQHQQALINAKSTALTDLRTAARSLLDVQNLSNLPDETLDALLEERFGNIFDNSFFFSMRHFS